MCETKLLSVSTALKTADLLTASKTANLLDVIKAAERLATPSFFYPQVSEVSD